MSGFHVDTASSVSILMKEVVRPSLKNRWQGSHSMSRPTRGKERGERGVRGGRRESRKGRRKEGGGRRKEEGGRKKEEGGRRKKGRKKAAVVKQEVCQRPRYKKEMEKARRKIRGKRGLTVHTCISITDARAMGPLHRPYPPHSCNYTHTYTMYMHLVYTA